MGWGINGARNESAHSLLCQACPKASAIPICYARAQSSNCAGICTGTDKGDRTKRGTRAGRPGLATTHPPLPTRRDRDDPKQKKLPTPRRPGSPARVPPVIPGAKRFPVGKDRLGDHRETAFGDICVTFETAPPGATPGRRTECSVASWGNGESGPRLTMLSITDLFGIVRAQRSLDYLKDLARRRSSGRAFP
jgi:hypothetical protein